MKLRNKVALAMVFCLLFNTTILSNYVAKAQALQDNNIIYNDGIAYTYEIKENGELILQSYQGDENNASFILHEDATAEVQITNNNSEENYNLEISELNENNLDISVYDKDTNKQVDHIDNLEDLEYEEYIGQSIGTATFAVYSISKFIEILLVLAIAIVMLGILCYNVCQTVDIVRDIASERTEKKQNQLYYIAYVQGPSVFIDINSKLNYDQAVSRLKNNGCTYTWFSNPAYLAAVGASVTGKVNYEGTQDSEINNSRKDGYVYFCHYHPDGRHTGAHSFFGLPFTK